MPELSIIGLNHRSAPLQIRETFAMDEGKRLEVLTELENFVEEIVVVSTCNRTEIIYHSLREDGEDKIRQFLCSYGDISIDSFNQFFYSHVDKQALLHLFRVASGLDSMVPGETQILGQLKAAFELSINHGHIRSNIQSIYQKMLYTAKLVRSRTGLGRGAVSFGSITVQLARNIFESLSDKSVLLIGAGEMCEMAGEHFMASGVKSIRIVNRSKKNAGKIADNFGGTSHTLAELPELLPKVDIILSSISRDGYIVTRDLALDAKKQRPSGPLFIVDIGVPRNIDPALNTLADIYLYNIDDLNGIIEQNMKNRRQEAGKAEKMVSREVDTIIGYNGKLAGELIRSLHCRVSDIKQRELSRLFQKNVTLTSKDKNEVEQTVNAIVNKILHDPIISLREGLKDENHSTNYIVRRFKDFFNL